MQKNIKEIYSKNLITVYQDLVVGEANEIMNNHNFRHLPVVDKKGFLVGIISKSDFMGLKYVDTRLTQFTIKQIMSSPVATISQFAKVKDVAQMFIEKKISAAVIIKDEEAAGIVTTEDLLRLLAQPDEKKYGVQEMDILSLASEGWISFAKNC